MPLSNDAVFDLTVLDLIEHSATGSVPRTPTYDEAVTRLLASRHIYNSVDHKEGYVTARSLSRLPLFHAAKLQEYLASGEDVPGLEANLSIFERYLQSLPAALRPHAETYRSIIAGRSIHHRAKPGSPAVRDPLNTIFLIPGAGPRPGLPGNYLHGVFSEKRDEAAVSYWCILISDSDNDAAAFETSSLGEALDKFHELLESVPFHLSELELLGFTLR